MGTFSGRNIARNPVGFNAKSPNSSLFVTGTDYTGPFSIKNHYGRISNILYFCVCLPRPKHVIFVTNLLNGVFIQILI